MREENSTVRHCQSDTAAKILIGVKYGKYTLHNVCVCICYSQVIFCFCPDLNENCGANSFCSRESDGSCWDFLIPLKELLQSSRSGLEHLMSSGTFAVLQHDAARNGSPTSDFQKCRGQSVAVGSWHKLQQPALQVSNILDHNQAVFCRRLGIVGKPTDIHSNRHLLTKTLGV